MKGKFVVLSLLGAAALCAQYGGGYDQGRGPDRGGRGQQRITDRRSASIRGGGGDGKCTIEVEVDDVAQVEIRGSNAVIRTLSGGPSIFRRFQCNQEMPVRPYQFRFEGVDGRGRQELIATPERGGTAIIRIDDPKGGREGYTFDIFWRGGNYGGGRRPY